jgi:hypothetical protein
LLLGVIDGTTGAFNDSCRGGLAESVRSGFSVMNNIGIYDPRLLAKFSLSNVNFTEATNQVYAFCDMTSLFSQFVTLADYQNPEQYIVLASRVGGAFINTFSELSTCISEGRVRNNGYDVGYCGGELFSVFLDTTL